MAATKTQDIAATTRQVQLIHAAGADLIRIACDSKRDVEALAEIRAQLRETIARRLHEGSTMHHLKLSSGDGERIAWLHARGDIVDQRSDGDTLHVAVKLSPENWERFQRL